MIIDKVISILAILPSNLPDLQRTRLRIPDSSGTFHPIDQLFYKDLGQRRFLGSHICAHPHISETVASNLRIPFLGLQALHLERIHLDNMAEQLPTRIRNTLLQYTAGQMLPEFLANAADTANVTSFQILLDSHFGPTTALLSEKMSTLQACPSLILYNDGIFTMNDFQGLVRIGTGGKEGRGDTIGQFGSGALTMFHISECAMIVSGDKVLFIDPCRRFFSGDFKDENVVLCSLQQVYEYVIRFIVVPV